MSNRTPNLGLYIRGPVSTENAAHGGVPSQWDFDLNMAIIDAAVGQGGASVLVNGGTVSNPNFNGTTPAAPAGNTNVVFQVSGSTVSAYVPNPPVTSVAGRTGAVTLAVADVSGAAPLASPALTGSPTAPTPATGDSSTLLATTAFVKAQNYVNAAGAAAAAPVQSVAGRVGVVTLAFTDISGAATTGQIPNLPASKITSGQLALAQGGNAADLSATGGTSQVLKQSTLGGVITVGQLAVADISGAAPLASPSLTGSPTAPTPSTGDSSTLIATTAFVKAQGYVTASTAPVVSVFGRAGAVVAASGDYTAAQVTNAFDTSVTQTAGTVYAGPASGSASAPTFRAQVASDLPMHLHNFIPFVNLQVGQVVEPTTVSAGDGGAINYTVPVGKRAVLDLYGIGITNAGDTLQVEVQIGGIWYSIGTALSTSATIPQVLGPKPFVAGNNIIYEAGDIIAIKGTTGGTAQVFGTIYTFSNTFALKSPRFVGTAALGDNTVYTVPVGKTALHVVQGDATSSSPQTVFNNNARSNGVVVRSVYRIGNNTEVSNGLSHLIAAAVQSPSISSNNTSFASMSAGGLINLKIAGGGATLLAVTSVASAAGGNSLYTGTITGGAGTALTLTAAANASGGTTVYTGTITGGTANGLIGRFFTVAGFTNSANNSAANTSWVCTASSATTITLANTAGVAETHAGTATQNIFAGDKFTIEGFSTAANNGLFLCVASDATHLSLANANGVAETRTASAAFAAFVVTSVANASAGSTVYTGVFTGGGSNDLAGWTITITGFTNAANNGTWVCTASSATSITLSNASGVSETPSTSALAALVSIENQLIYLNYVVEI